MIADDADADGIRRSVLLRVGARRPRRISRYTGIRGCRLAPDTIPARVMQSFYKEIVLDHFQRPRNRDEIEGAHIEEHLSNPLCGDEVTVYANLRDGKVERVSFTGRGCSISQASASMLTEHLEGKSREGAATLIETFLEMMRTEENPEMGELAALKGIIQAPNRIRCATLAWDAFKRGLAGP
jgi:nitrogen fixation NifU-like protein